MFFAAVFWVFLLTGKQVAHKKRAINSLYTLSDQPISEWDS